ncbi:glycosyltransferase family 4 protein [Novosphingobium sp. BW1]|uniref:glycosyltransferase family 4 protein n=1 Tax=Novosphingobium sp. BW1 TaxID=2592621 RepID=UPI0011DEB851|nr:glycosyltransferase family 4 protein [Novosphingobium sp. BW1]TYC85092.1 glycosyltransferase family 4 protein [Novosphingobium sp. BW1]
MPSSNPQRRSVLIVAHAAHVTGGVNNFLRIMRKCYRDRVAALRFINGARLDEPSKGAKLARLIKDYARFAGLQAKRQFEIVHVNPSLDYASLPRELAFLWIARAFRPKTKLLLFYRGWDWTALDAIKKSGWKSRLFVATNRKADRILVLASSFKHALMEMGIDGNRIFLGSTMFEKDMFANLPATPLEDRRTILFLSRFLPAKGGAQILEAFARLAGDYPDWKVVMAGDGPEYDALQKQARDLGIVDRVEFTGYIASARKARLLLDTSIFLLPSEHPEGMPNAVLEGMAAGAVIVTTPVGGLADILTDGENGIILKSSSTDDVEAALRHYLPDPEARCATGERNRELAWQSWESDIVSDRMADHYDAVIAQG